MRRRKPRNAGKQGRKPKPLATLTATPKAQTDNGGTVGRNWQYDNAKTPKRE